MDACSRLMRNNVYIGPLSSFMTMKGMKIMK